VALTRGGNTACVINAANEIAVAAFLNNRIKFSDIYRIIRNSVDNMSYIAEPTYDDYVATNLETRRYAESLIK
jgi:1-deoxy-D-xylulose-5-phosphate reductoisomerase